MMLSKRMSHRLTVFVLVFVLASLMLVPSIAAQDATTEELTGTLERIDGNAIIVSGQTISILGAEIHAPLSLGVQIKVHVNTVDGVLVAREIELALPGVANSNANMNANANTNANANMNANANVNDNVSLDTAITAQDALATVLRVYPTTQIRSIELTTRFGGTAVWEVKISGRIEVIVDAQSGDILVINRAGDDNNSSANTNGNSNANNNGNENSNDNEADDDQSNSNTNSNDNNNSNSNSNGNDNNDDDGGDNSSDDDEGMGGMD